MPIKPDDLCDEDGLHHLRSDIESLKVEIARMFPFSNAEWVKEALRNTADTLHSIAFDCAWASPKLRPLFDKENSNIVSLIDLFSFINTFGTDALRIKPGTKVQTHRGIRIITDGPISYVSEAMEENFLKQFPHIEPYIVAFYSGSAGDLFFPEDFQEILANPSTRFR